MREMLAARSGHDFVTSSRAPGEGRAIMARLSQAFAMALVRNPSRVFGCSIAFAAVGVVALNALAWQTARHPSPLFTPKPSGRFQRLPDPPIAAPAAPLPPMRPMEVVAVPTPPLPTAPARPQRDPIGDLIRATETGAVRVESQRLVATAQRALTNLGYGPLRADGIMGQGTRQAIERFEREYKLEVTGELNPRTLRELSGRAAMPIE
jgi:Putative peptidoglycan binding domain